MQKLIWTNANGDSVDLTSGHYGITNWEGFSNTSLNIQSQQVPFQDGAVFLDALMEQRELTVTLAMNDEGSLETRYRLRRELIHILNPKLGEGYLIYKNDFTQKRIKCVPQIPLFETHNSDTVGTPKASLSWTACEPYWEDLEENEVVFELYEQPTIKNEGDVSTQLKIDWLTTNVNNGELKNLTTNKKIKYNGLLNKNLTIITEIGKKSVTTKDIGFEIKNTGIFFMDITYSEKLNLFVSVGSKSTIITSPDGINWEFNCDVNGYWNGITYSPDLNLFVVVGLDSNITNCAIATSSDGINWTTRTSSYVGRLKDITYSESLNLFATVGESGIILTSPDGINWTSRTSGTSVNLNRITYSESLNLFVAVGESGIILTSSDGINWTTRTSGTSEILYGVVYSESLNLFVIAVYDRGVILKSSDGINWTKQTGIPNYGNYYDVTYSEELNLFVLVGTSNTINVSPDGINWSLVTTSGSLDFTNVIYSSNLGIFVTVGNYGMILTSPDGINWITRMGVTTESNIYDVTYSEKLSLYVAVTSSVIMTSSDGKEWIKRLTTGRWRGVVYSEKLNLFVTVGDNGYIRTSSDGINWITRTSGTSHLLYDVVYSEKLNLFVTVGAYGVILTSPDGINWTSRTSEASYILYSLVYSEKLNLFVVVGDRILTSPDGINWTVQRSVSTLYSVTYSESLNLFVAVSSYIITSPDGINWTVQNNNQLNNKTLRSIDYSKEVSLFITVGEDGIIFTSPDGINWAILDSKLFYDLYSITYIKTKGFTILGGEYSIILNSYIKSEENEIQKLSTDSDMNLNLQIGNNQFLANRTGGSMKIKITYRQKYIGV